MTRTLVALLLTATLALGGCAMIKGRWNALTPDQQASIIEAGTRAAVKPQCRRLDQLKGPADLYSDLCETAIEDGLKAARAGLADDWSLVCPAFAETAALCEHIPDGTPDRDVNVATCESVLEAAGALCAFSLSSSPAP